jgi:hypothetical protein
MVLAIPMYTHMDLAKLIPLCLKSLCISRVGQNRISAPYMTVCMVIFLLKNRMYTVYTYKCMVLANPMYIINMAEAIHIVQDTLFGG